VRRLTAEATADRLIAAGAVGLFVALLLPWSHQISAPVLALPDARVALRGVPPDPTAWQVYSIADVLLVLLAAALAAAALAGSRRFRVGVLPAIALALAFTAHAVSAPPTNRVELVNPYAAVPAYQPGDPTAAVGETVAIASLAVAGGGVALSLRAK
jgi:hypothetical protein